MNRNIINSRLGKRNNYAMNRYNTLVNRKTVAEYDDEGFKLNAIKFFKLTMYIFIISLLAWNYISTINAPSITLHQSFYSSIIDSNDIIIDLNSKDIINISIDNILIASNKNPIEIVETHIGEKEIEIDYNTQLHKYNLPNVYYKDIDYSSFQPYMCYTAITNRSTNSWKIVHGKNSYTDENGFRRYKNTSNKFTIDGQDDYIIALGTFYKKKGITGNRYLVKTTTGMYTATTGDEKSDAHTDSKNMFTRHGKGGKAGMIEWILDLRSGKVPATIKKYGSVTRGPVLAMRGKILYIYEII